MKRSFPTPRPGSANTCPGLHSWACRGGGLDAEQKQPVQPQFLVARLSPRGARQDFKIVLPYMTSGVFAFVSTLRSDGHVGQL